MHLIVSVKISILVEFNDEYIQVSWTDGRNGEICVTVIKIIISARCSPKI